MLANALAMWYWDDDISLELSPGEHNISRPPGGLPNFCPGSLFAWMIVVSLFLLSFYSSQFVEYKNRWTRAERDGENGTDQDRTNTDGDRNAGWYGWGRSDQRVVLYYF